LDVLYKYGGCLGIIPRSSDLLGFHVRDYLWRLGALLENTANKAAGGEGGGRGLCQLQPHCLLSPVCIHSQSDNLCSRFVM
jgi:hypothetical protein